MRALFLDRDGVINENRPDYVTSWGHVRLIGGALSALHLLSRAGWPLFIVTNQAAVNHGLLSVGVLEQINQGLVSVAARHGATIRDLRFCPHRPDEGCACRKPRPGMLLDLATAYGIDLSQSYMIGDALSDIAAGQAAGCQTIMVRTGRGREQLALPEAERWRPDKVCADLLAAAEWLLAEDRPAPGAPLGHQMPFPSPLAYTEPGRATGS